LKGLLATAKESVAQILSDEIAYDLKTGIRATKWLSKTRFCFRCPAGREGEPQTVRQLREVILMKLRLTFGLLLVAVCGVLPAWPQAPTGSQLLVLTNANVIDGVSEKPIHHATIIVREGKILSVATTSPKIPHGAAVLDLKGRWLLPGLIDAH